MFRVAGLGSGNDQADPGANEPDNMPEALVDDNAEIREYYHPSGF